MGFLTRENDTLKKKSKEVFDKEAAVKKKLMKLEIEYDQMENDDRWVYFNLGFVAYNDRMKEMTISQIKTQNEDLQEKLTIAELEIDQVKEV